MLSLLLKELTQLKRMITDDTIEIIKFRIEFIDNRREAWFQTQKNSCTT